LLSIPILALETIDNNISKNWNRRQATIEKFDQAVEIAEKRGFIAGAQDLNAFMIFGLPNEDLQAVVNTALYAPHRIGCADALYPSPRLHTF
jgi:radical SAM superfamily enzyme